MISFLDGKIILKKDDFVVLEVNGVGYEVFLSRNSLSKIPREDQNLKVFCYLDVGEKSLKLFGFLTFEDLEFFKILRSISGIGPKTSLEICGKISLAKMREEIKKGDEKIFEGIPGVGPQKAKKIILELSGKLKTSLPQKKENLEDEALSALINLGFQKTQAQKALSQVSEEIKDPEEKIKEALKILSK